MSSKDTVSPTTVYLIPVPPCDVFRTVASSCGMLDFELPIARNNAGVHQLGMFLTALFSIVSAKEKADRLPHPLISCRQSLTSLIENVGFAPKADDSSEHMLLIILGCGAVINFLISKLYKISFDEMAAFLFLIP